MIINPGDKFHITLSELALKHRVEKDFLKNGKNFNIIQRNKPRLTGKGYELLMELDSGRKISI